MRSAEYIMKVRTTAELSVMIKSILVIVGLSTTISLFFVKKIGGAIFLLLWLVAIVFVAYLVTLWAKNALMMNVIGYQGIRNEYLGSPICDLSWDEIGDFGIAEVKSGLFKGKYIYMSRIFVDKKKSVDIIRTYDPRICVVLPYTEETRRAIRVASGDKIDID